MIGLGICSPIAGISLWMIFLGVYFKGLSFSFDMQIEQRSQSTPHRIHAC